MNQKPNQLINETSPYLLQHASNPVNWYPWGEAAFAKAKAENKPVFLSIGYSTCHWCHVMAHESFEDEEVAELLNAHFVAIKVDKEERPDIDSIYMSVCQTFTGSGGWPTSIFMTPTQKPFYAGTYFSKRAKHGRIGLIELLQTIAEKWVTNKAELIKSADSIVAHLNVTQKYKSEVAESILSAAFAQFEVLYDDKFGGFGNAPKFPTPHNLLFLLDYYEQFKDEKALFMVEKTLTQMYKGGIFDHIGFGFSRYSTDEYYLVPHFEKMLYDNALLMMAYTRAYAVTNRELYQRVAKKVAQYVMRELTDVSGAFYSAQDADSDGVEGKYYVFSEEEIIELLGKEKGEEFNAYYGISALGNFEGANIPNVLHQDNLEEKYEAEREQVFEYRKTRTKLHLDDKILTSWNSMMIAAFAMMYRVFGERVYLETAEKACRFIERNLCEKDKVFVSYRDGRCSNEGFLDDYAWYEFALMQLYEATLEKQYFKRAIQLCKKAVDDFYDVENSGFFLYGKQNEQLIVKPKEMYDGAMPSGNSVMTYNLVKLMQMTEDEKLTKLVKDQLEFMAGAAENYPSSHSFYLSALCRYLYPPTHLVCVLRETKDKERLKGKIPLGTNLVVLEQESAEYKLLHDKTTFYLCKNYHCLPPTNDVCKVLKDDEVGIE